MTKWELFGGAHQDPGQICSVGCIHHISNAHYLQVKENLGRGTNNVEELTELLLLIKTTIDKGIFQIHVHGDSLKTINWMKDQLQMEDIS